MAKQTKTTQTNQPVKPTQTTPPVKTSSATPLVKASVAKHEPAAILFAKENFKWMLIGIVVMAIGFFLMTGGKSDNPNNFDVDSVYSTTRITIAPILIIAGLIIEIFAIMRKPKNSEV